MQTSFHLAPLVCHSSPSQRASNIQSHRIAIETTTTTLNSTFRLPTPRSTSSSTSLVLLQLDTSQCLSLLSSLSSSSPSPLVDARRLSHPSISSAQRVGLSASLRHPPPPRASALLDVQNSAETRRMTRLVHLSLRPGLHRCKSVQNSQETRPTTRLFAIRPGPLRCSCRTAQRRVQRRVSSTPTSGSPTYAARR